MKGIVILGTARSNGNTRKMVNEVVSHTNWDIVDLNDYNIGHYDYDHNYENDDFLKLIRQIVENNDLLIFATPVYWYSMSAVMKTFFDRLSDLLRIEKDLGRKLRGKSMAVVNNSNGGNLGEDFWHPFKATAEYLGMHYLGGLHTLESNIDKMEIKAFVDKIQNHSIPPEVVR